MVLNIYTQGQQLLKRKGLHARAMKAPRVSRSIDLRRCVNLLLCELNDLIETYIFFLENQQFIS